MHTRTPAFCRSRRWHRLAAAGILLVLAGAPGWGRASSYPAVEPPAGKLPEAARPAPGSKAAAKLRIAEGFIAMINDGSAGAVEKFESAHRAPRMLEAVGIPERVTRVARMHEEFGELAITGVTSADDTGVSLVAVAKNGQTVAMTFEFDEASGGKLTGVTLEIGGHEVVPRALTPEARAATIEAACRALEENYVFPEKAAEMAARVLGKLKAGEYDGIGSEAALAQRITDDFRSIADDRHMRLALAPAGPEQSQGGAHSGDGEGPLGNEEKMARENYAFRKVEMLPGNIGYIKFDLFLPSEGAKKAASAAMAFVSHADAIIFDMRGNGGGSPEMIRYISSYLFDSRTHLNDMVDRTGKTVEEYWTLDEVPGGRVGSKVPVYVLTSSYTFSGAEEFTYNLKNLKRATIIGQTTGARTRWRGTACRTGS